MFWTLPHDPLWDLALNPGPHTHFVNTPSLCCMTALFSCNVLFENKVSVYCPGTHSVMQADPPIPFPLSWLPELLDDSWTWLNLLYTVFSVIPPPKTSLWCYMASPKETFQAVAQGVKGYPTLL